MKVLLTKDVYKLGRAGDIKKVADGYGRNYLIPQGMAILATAGAMKQAERIRQKAGERRAILNEEMGVVAEAFKKVKLSFSARAGETGKLYGSITSQEIAVALQEKSGYEIKRQQLDMQPIRSLGEHTVRVRLTMDLIPEIQIGPGHSMQSICMLHHGVKRAVHHRCGIDLQLVSPMAELPS